MTPITLTAILLIIVWIIWLKIHITVQVLADRQKLHYRHGKLQATLNSGRYTFWGRGHSFVELDTRLQPITLQTQELTTSEGLSVKVTAVGLYKIDDPVLAISSTTSYSDTLYTLIQLALRDLVNGLSTEELIASTRTIGPRLLEEVKRGATQLGLNLTELTIRDIILPSEVKAALSATWRTEKEARAELEQARGKAASVRALANSAKLYTENPELLKIRYFETLEKMSSTYGNTFIVGLPEDKALSLQGKTNS